MSSLRLLLATCSTVAVVSTLAACARKPPVLDDDHMSHMAAGDLAAPPPAPLASTSVSQGDPNLPPSANQAPGRLSSSPRHGEWVKIAWTPGSSDSLMAWIVYPSTSRAKSPVVVVVHEIYGLSTWIRGVTDQLASQGFIAIAPDLNSRVRGGPSTEELSRDSATKLIRGVGGPERIRGITAAADYAMSQPSAARRYGVIGFCWGGGTTWMYAINGGTTGYSGAVAFYGDPYMSRTEPGATPEPIRDSLAKIQKPIMMFNGANDARTGAPMPAIEADMKSLGKWYYSKNYEGAIHGFVRAQDDPTNPPKPAEQEANLTAVKDAWPRTISFLKENLGLE